MKEEAVARGEVDWEEDGEESSSASSSSEEEEKPGITKPPGSAAATSSDNFKPGTAQKLLNKLVPKSENETIRPMLIHGVDFRGALRMSKQLFTVVRKVTTALRIWI